MKLNNRIPSPLSMATAVYAYGKPVIDGFA
jgi:hypothetical protein